MESKLVLSFCYPCPTKELKKSAELSEEQLLAVCRCPLVKYNFTCFRSMQQEQKAKASYNMSNSAHDRSTIVPEAMCVQNKREPNRLLDKPPRPPNSAVPYRTSYTYHQYKARPGASAKISD